MTAAYPQFQLKTDRVQGVNHTQVNIVARQAARLGIPETVAAKAPTRVIRIVHLSDTHDVSYREVPAGDILVHSGDFTDHGHPDEVRHFRAWLQSMPHTHKVIVCGNHEIGMDKLTAPQLQAAVCEGVPNAFVLQDMRFDILGLSFFGSAWNNAGSGHAWGATQEQRAQYFQRIPQETDILVTHLPAWLIFDLAAVGQTQPGVCRWCNRTHDGAEHWGDWSLRQRIQQCKIPVHMFGHVHQEPGAQAVEGTVYCNASMDMYRKCVVVDVTALDLDRLPAATASSSATNTTTPPPVNAAGGATSTATSGAATHGVPSSAMAARATTPPPQQPRREPRPLPVGTGVRMRLFHPAGAPRVYAVQLEAEMQRLATADTTKGLVVTEIATSTPGTAARWVLQEIAQTKQFLISPAHDPFSKLTAWWNEADGAVLAWSKPTSFAPSNALWTLEWVPPTDPVLGANAYTSPTQLDCYRIHCRGLTTSRLTLVCDSRSALCLKDLSTGSEASRAGWRPIVLSFES